MIHTSLYTYYTYVTLIFLILEENENKFYFIQYVDI